MKKRVLIIATAAAIFLISANAMAHSLWVNVNASFAHPPGHALSSIGWGHAMALDDFLTSEWGNVELDRYEIISPDNKATELTLPVIAVQRAIGMRVIPEFFPGLYILGKPNFLMLT